jgi:hypothetical protein
VQVRVSSLKEGKTAHKAPKQTQLMRRLPGPRCAVSSPSLSRDAELCCLPMKQGHSLTRAELRHRNRLGGLAVPNVDPDQMTHRGRGDLELTGDQVH